MIFKDAYAQWENADGGCVSFAEGESGIEIDFTSDANLFTSNGFDPVWIPAFTEAHFNINTNRWNTNTKIYFNNTGLLAFLWTRINQTPYFNFTHVSLHELGHMLGLNHCTAGGNPVMYEIIDASKSPRMFLKSPDEQGIANLCNVVGIEDYIWITMDYSNYNVNQIYLGSNHRQFIDVWPYGDYITEWGPWKIYASYGCGNVLVFQTESESYINIPNLPEGYLWERDENGNVLATISTSGIDNTGYNHYASVPITIGNVPNTIITSGTLSENTVWRGCITITGDITVPSGITLTIYPNANITFQNNSSLIVNGTLNATECELNGGLDTWGTITFDGSTASNSILDNVVIKNGDGIRILNGANVSISNSTIDHCTEGIYFYNSQPSIVNNQIIEPVQNGINGDASGMSVEILNNTITKSAGNPQYKQYQGIILGNNTNGYIAHNDISGFMWGMYIGGGSDAYFTNYQYQTFNPNNRLRDNSIGIGAGWGGNIFSSPFKPAYGYNNSIYNNSVYDAKSYQYSNIYARYNWWGTDGAQIYVDGTSSLDASYPLSTDPWNQQQEDNMNIIPIISNYSTDESVNLINPQVSGNVGDNFNPDSSILAGIYLEIQGRIHEAIIHYKQMVSNNAYPGFALGRLVGIKNRYQIHNIRDYLITLLGGNKPYKPIVLTLLAGILLGEDDYEQAIFLYNQIINDYPNTYAAVNALFEKFFAALNYDKDRVLAGQLLSELQSLGLTDEEYLMRLAIAENLYNGNGSAYFGKSNDTNSENTVSNIPREYSLLGNYPNPFNPTTNISYALPYQSSVELVIYDIMGRVIKSFNIAAQSSGYQTLIWDGTNENRASVSSGVYLYRIIAKSLENNEKFVKTSKLMLLK